VRRTGPLIFAAALSGCAPTVSEVHAQALHQHLVGLSRAAAEVAADSGRRPRCQQGDDPVNVRAATMDQELTVLRDRAEDGADGRWPSQEAFREALEETSQLQQRLALLRAEYDACRALSARPVDETGVSLAPGSRRVAALDVTDPGSILSPDERARLSAHLRVRLAPVFPLVPADAVGDAQIDHMRDRACPAACALAVAREVGAHKVVAVRLEKTDDKCAVILEVHDLATGLTERARTVREDCGALSLLAGLEDAVAPLIE